MVRRIVLAVATDFLRILIRQLLREQPDVEVIGAYDSLAESVKHRNAHVIVVDPMACVALPSAVAELARRYSGRILLVGEGPAIALPRGLQFRDVIPVPAGSKIAPLDLPAFASRLATALSREYAAPSPDSVASGQADAAPAAGTIDNIGVLEDNIAARARLSHRPALLAIAASTGGPQALQELLAAVDPPVCPIIIALHLPSEHTAGMVAHLAATTGHAFTIGDSGPLPGNAIVLLRGGGDYAVTRSAGGFHLQRVYRNNSAFHPNGTVLLASIAGLNCPVAGLLLTGMGDDGCQGARELTARGYPVLAQSPSSCAVPGMPNAAIAAGAVTEVLPLAALAERINSWFVLPAAS